MPYDLKRGKQMIAVGLKSAGDMLRRYQVHIDGKEDVALGSDRKVGRHLGAKSSSRPRPSISCPSLVLSWNALTLFPYNPCLRKTCLSAAKG